MIPPVSLALAILVIASSALAGPRPADRQYDSRVIHAGPAGGAKAPGDTINLMGMHGDPTNGPGEPLYYGDFQDATGNPDWNGWISRDLTRPAGHHWQVSDYNQFAPGNLAAWCGDLSYASCDTLDADGGYGNNWHEVLEFRHTVGDPGLDAQVKVTARLQIDTEPAYDFVHLSFRSAQNPYQDLAIWDGDQALTIDVSTLLSPEDYLDGTDVALQFRFTSDGGWSDEDCLFSSAGAVQIDDVTVTITNGGVPTVHFTDFQDGSFGFWTPSAPPGVGDFAKIWTRLHDIDPCHENPSPQVAFIDDGQVVPGTGGTPCISWCYGPLGFIVNNSGGLLGYGHHLKNQILSPVMDWPDDTYEGVWIEWLLYSHESLGPDSPGIFQIWGVRSADTDGSAGNGIQDIQEQPWRDRAFIYGTMPGRYRRFSQDVSDLMNPGRDKVQVAHTVLQLGWFWGWDGPDGTPAPYFDDVKVQVFDHAGPAMTAREIDLAQDGFPERGSLDYGDLGSLHVRFDMARNISPSGHMRLDFGDSIVAAIAPVREGAVLHGTPELHYRLSRNPVFDPYRTAGLPDAGSVPGFPALNPSGTWDLRRWAFDLPDSGFLFPGDVLHYFLQAQDAVGGADVRTVTLPPDTTGFSTPYDPHRPYDDAFAFRALPTLEDDGFGGFTTPPILVWYDHGHRGQENAWAHALSFGTGSRLGGQYEIFYTNGPTSGVGNGLGGKAVSAQNLSPYTAIYYTSGDRSVSTLGNGDFASDPSDDLGILTDWLAFGERNLFLTGDNLAGDLLVQGPAGQAFLTEVVGVSYDQFTIAPLIGDRKSPLVAAQPGNPVIQNVAAWIPFGGCPGLRSFDAVTPAGSGQSIAEFTDPAGQRGAYPYAAANLNLIDASQGRVVYLPYDLAHILTPPQEKVDAPQPARNLLLRDVTAYFGLEGIGQPVPAIPVPDFTVRSHPNPFNPLTRIIYTVPRAGHLSLKVYDLRGRLVRTLVDGRAPAGADQVAVWDGTDEGGAAVSSGVYFYEARTGGEVQVGKMALVR